MPSISRGVKGGAERRNKARAPRRKGGLLTIQNLLAPTALKVLERPTAVDAHDTSMEIRDFQYLGSYSWVDTPQPTILVPGSPRIWAERATPYMVPPDHGKQFMDQNGHRVPGMPFLTMFRALDALGAEIDWRAVDIVTNRNGLRKLLRWIAGGTKANQPFRIDAQLAGGRTVMLNRWETHTQEKQRGWGAGFEQASTLPAPGCERAASVGHQRIVKYSFAGLTMVVIFEVDACLPQTAKKAPSALAAEDTLSDQLSQLQIQSTADSGGPHINVIHAGAHIPQDALIELTTARNRKWGYEYPQLFFSQTPHHFSAGHEGDRFHTVVKRHVGDSELMEAERGLQRDLQRLGCALKNIQELVVQHGLEGRLSLVYENREMRVFERTRRTSCLPMSVLGRFRH